MERSLKHREDEESTQMSMLAVAKNEAANAKRALKKETEELTMKLNAASSVINFILPRLGQLELTCVGKNVCNLEFCDELANVQFGRKEPEFVHIKGCGHKFCNACLIGLVNFKNKYNRGACPLCRGNIVNIIDVIFTPEDEENQNQVSKNVIIFQN